MNITNEKLYEIIVEIRSDMSEFKTEIRSEIAEFKAEIRSDIAEIKATQSELRSNISKWGIVLFIGSIVAMTSIIGVFLASVVLTIAQ